MRAVRVSIGRSERGAISLALTLLLSGLTVAGAGVGAALDQAGVFGSSGETTVAAADTVPVLQCPDGASIGVLRRGDRVLATGRTSDNDWVEIRDPRNLANRVWVARAVVIPDRSLTGLSVHSCVIPTTTTTTAPPAAPTTTTSTTRPSSTGTTTAPAPAPADTTGPTISGIALGSKFINEAIQSCTTTSTSVSAGVSDPSGVASVTMTWSPNLGSNNPTKAMAGGPTYATTFGPFGNVVSSNTPITLTITAKDSLGNTSTLSTSPGSMTLNNCP